jgi:hypothetical protein
MEPAARLRIGNEYEAWMKNDFWKSAAALLGGWKTSFPSVTVSHTNFSWNELELNTGHHR